MARKQRGRPLKFGRPARLLALTLPHDIVAALRRIHPDPAWAIVALYERTAKRPRPVPPPRQPAIDLAQLSARSALIVVDPRALRNAPGMSVVPVASGRAFLAFDEGRGLADLELAILEQLRDPRTAPAARKELRALERQVRSWRRGRGFRLSKRSIILIERTARARVSRSARSKRTG
ncbi:MAG TPA: hypothetical protein VIE44_09240 [Methylomirabilota bacterium]